MGRQGWNRRDWLQALCLATVLMWLLVAPLCPGAFARIMPDGGAAAFMGCLFLGSAAACLVSLRRCEGSGAARWRCLLLPAGVALALVCELAALPYRPAWLCLAGLLAGAGLGEVLLQWGRTFAACLLSQTMRLVSVACIMATLVGCAIVGLEHSTLALWAICICCALIGCLGAMLPPRASSADAQAESPVEQQAPADAPHSPADLLPKLWETAVGLGLSLMSTILPWGSMLANDVAAMPIYWSFAAGIALLCLGVAGACRYMAEHFDFDVSAHIVVPVLAAAVVGLRMLGDLDQIGIELTAFKGVGSGMASAGFLVFALVGMTHVARQTQRVQGTFGLGLGIACLIGSMTLPLHMAHQQFASLVAPLLSLVFLVASCCSSVVHIRKHAAAQEPKPLTIEEAVERICRDYALSPRERQVMSQLVLGRSAESIGAILGISPNTVRSHVGNIHTKLSISSRDELADLVEATMKKPLDKTPAQ